MKNRDVDYRYDRPTVKAREYAKSLGIADPDGMSATELARAIDAVRKKQEMDRNRSILSKLLEGGLCIGSLIETESFRGWVWRIWPEKGQMSIRVYPTGVRFLKTPDRVKLTGSPQSSLDFFDLDSWTPPGFNEIPRSLANKILSGEFGEEIKRELKIRDSFFSVGRETRKFLLFESVLDKIQKSIEKNKQAERAEREAAIQSHRERQELKFCAQCGKEMMRPQGVSLQRWNGQRRCDVCKENYVSLSEKKHCSQCGVLFERQEGEGADVWGGRKNCSSCRSNEQGLRQPV